MHRYFLSTRGFSIVGGLLLIAAFLASGCGGSSSSEDVTFKVGALSESEFISKADKICEEGHNNLQREFAALIKTTAQSIKNNGEKPSASDTEALRASAVNDVIVPIYTEMLEKIAGAGGPQANASQVEAFMEEAQQKLGDAEGEPDNAFKPIFFRDTATLARKAGLPACAESFG
jgi:hypothetical protein